MTSAFTDKLAMGRYISMIDGQTLTAFRGRIKASA